METNNIIKKCKKYDYEAQFMINILVHISFLVFILTLVFSFYTENIMTESINNQVNNLVNENVDKYFDKTVTKDKINTIEEIKSIFKTFFIDPKKYTQMAKNLFINNEDRNSHNSLIKRSLYIFSATLLFTVLVAFVISKSLCSNIDLTDILLENFIIFFFVGVIELCFFKFIILKYIPVYPSHVKNIVLDELKKY